MYELWTPPLAKEIAKLSPLSVELNITKEWEDFINKVLIKTPTKISDLTKIKPAENWKDKQSTFIMGIAYDKNLRNKLEVTASKGGHIQDKEILELLKQKS